MRNLMTSKNKAVHYLIIISLFLFSFKVFSLQKKQIVSKFYEGVEILGIFQFDRNAKLAITHRLEGKKLGMTNLSDNSYSTIQGLDNYKNLINDLCQGDVDNDEKNELVGITDLDLIIFEEVNKTWVTSQEKNVKLYQANAFGKESLRNFAEETRPARPLILKESAKKGVKVMIADITNDNKNEIILLKNAGGFNIFQFIEVDILKWEKNGLEGLINFVLPGTGQQGIEVLDLDDDDKNELVIATYNTINIYQYNLEINDLVSKAAPMELAPSIGDQRMTMGFIDDQLILVHCITNIDGEDNPDDEVGIVKRYAVNQRKLVKMKKWNYLPSMKLDYDKYRTTMNELTLPSNLFSNVKELIVLPKKYDQQGKKFTIAGKFLLKDVNNDLHNDIVLNTNIGAYIFYVTD